MPRIKVFIAVLCFNGATGEMCWLFQAWLSTDSTEHYKIEKEKDYNLGCDCE